MNKAILSEFAGTEPRFLNFGDTMLSCPSTPRGITRDCSGDRHSTVLVLRCLKGPYVTWDSVIVRPLDVVVMIYRFIRWQQGLAPGDD